MLFVIIRSVMATPLSWQIGFASAIPKYNGKKDYAGFRLVCLLDFLGKAWLGELWELHPQEHHLWAVGFAKHRRKEEAVFWHRILQWRCQQVAPQLHVSWFFEKKDISNAFPSIDFTCLDRVVSNHNCNYEDSVF